ncbi:DUF1661 domain-containing protein [Porphyromonas sp. COT-052 OH4946]|uniref:DUF1661 domain-containing protein n=1 Tax=Porphyromonas sp. COT-052 OH4946 TaxID=1515618 RepID=UPI00190F3AB1|nr:DUF1661 domain-containing protein [Porphyromonas sp. COT-052 OH4946]
MVREVKISRARTKIFSRHFFRDFGPESAHFRCVLRKVGMIDRPIGSGGDGCFTGCGQAKPRHKLFHFRPACSRSLRKRIR